MPNFSSLATLQVIFNFEFRLIFCIFEPEVLKKYIKPEIFSVLCLKKKKYFCTRTSFIRLSVFELSWVLSEIMQCLYSQIMLENDFLCVLAGTRQVHFAPSCEILIGAFICTEPKLLRPQHFFSFFFHLAFFRRVPEAETTADHCYRPIERRAGLSNEQRVGEASPNTIMFKPVAARSLFASSISPIIK